MNSRQTNKKSGATTAEKSKQLLVEDYKRRLKDNVKSINENLCRILSAVKITSEESVTKNNQASRMADYSVLRNELCTRAALITKAADELFMLNNDVREFLILRDFNFLTNSMKSIEKQSRAELLNYQNTYSKILHELSSMNADINHELLDNFGLR